MSGFSLLDLVLVVPLIGALAVTFVPSHAFSAIRAIALVATSVSLLSNCARRVTSSTVPSV